MSWTTSSHAFLNKVHRFLIKYEDRIVPLPLATFEDFTVGRNCWVRGPALEGGYSEEKQAVIVATEWITLPNETPTLEIRVKLHDKLFPAPGAFYPRWDEITIAKGGFGGITPFIESDNFFFDFANSRLMFAPFLTAFMARGTYDWIPLIIWFPCIVLNSEGRVNTSGKMQLDIRVPHVGIRRADPSAPLINCREFLQLRNQRVFTVFDLRHGDAIRSVAGPKKFPGHGKVMRHGGLLASANPLRYDCECRFPIGPNAACACVPAGNCQTA